MTLESEWLNKALSDLQSAKQLAAGDLAETCVYHTQQCAEKCLKAFLVFHKQPIIKSHDLILLLELCLDIDDSLEDMEDFVHILNPYSTAYRYPSPGEASIALEEALEAVQLAEKIYQRFFAIINHRKEGALK